MSMGNPFVTTIRGIKFPETLPEIDQLKERMLAHVTRVTIEQAGLPDVLRLLESLEQYRDDVAYAEVLSAD